VNFIPETKGLYDLLREFRSNHYHLSIVVDEFGNIAGLVTMEDVLEQIVGEIEDEFDTPDEEGDISVRAGKYLSDKYNGMYNKAYANYQRDVMEELFLDLAGVGQVDLGEAAGEPVDVYASVGDTGGWHSMQLTVAYNLLYVTATAAELGYTIEGAPKRMTPEGTPLLHRLIKAVRAQSSLLNIRTSQILLVTSDGARYAIHRSYEDGDVYNAVEV
jgi:hypothetical protein